MSSIPITLLLLVGCDPPGVLTHEQLVDTAGVGEPHEVHPELELPPAFDPLLSGPLPIHVSYDGDVELLVLDEGGQVLVTLEGPSWDGRLPDGSWAPAGRYQVQARPQAVGDPDVLPVSRSVQLVRCGIAAAWAEGDDGLTATRIPMYWHGSEALDDPALPFVELSGLEGDDGQPTALPEPAEELTWLPEDASLPMAFTWDSRPILALEPGESEVFGGSGLQGAGVTLAAHGWSRLDGADPVEPGQIAVFQRDEALAAGPAVVDEVLTLLWEVVDEEGRTWEVASQDMPVRWLSMPGSPTFRREGDMYQPWAAAVVPALEALAGVGHEPASVLDALVTWIYDHHGIAYDTRSGASYYTRYVGSDWERARFDLTAYLDRRYGSTVNCTDCASILVTWANMLGASLDYTIMLQGFSLNYIHAIGTSGFTRCPFGSHGCGFSYHAVTTDDGGGTIWDATLALDGDSDPGSPPHDFMEVHGVDGEEYIHRLVMSGRPEYHYSAQVTLQ